MVYAKKFIFNDVAENTYVVYNDQKDAVIVDCGCMNPQEQGNLILFIQQFELKVHALLNTHLHFDHTWGASFALKHWPDIIAYTHRDEVEKMPSPSRQLAMFGIADNFNDISPERLRYLEDGDKLTFGSLSFDVLYVPGHSPGHLAFYNAEGEFVLVGDVLFRENVGRADLWGGDLNTLLNSIRTKLFTLPDHTVVYSGHGPETSIQYEKQNNPYLI